MQYASSLSDPGEVCDDAARKNGLQQRSQIVGATCRSQEDGLMGILKAATETNLIM